MNNRIKRSTIAMLVAPALALSASAALAQGQNQQQQEQARQQQQAQQQQGALNVQQLYRSTWSADEMIGTNVRGANGEEIGEVKDILVDRNGNITRVIVEVGGFLEMGDQHIGVPWKDVRIGQDMNFIQVPLREVENGTYSLYGRVPQGEDVIGAPGTWRVNELIGEYASLEDVQRYGIVSDVLFDAQGGAQAVVVNRGTGPWGRGGWYGYPYSGFYPGAYAYPLPYRGTTVGEIGRFDYRQYGEQSRVAGGGMTNRGQQQAQRQGTAAAGR